MKIYNVKTRGRLCDPEDKELWNSGMVIGMVKLFFIYKERLKLPRLVLV